MIEEIVSHQNNFAAQIAEYVNSDEALSDPATRRDYFAKMSGDDFINMTQQIASLVRTGDSDERQYFDGKKVKLVNHEIPDPRDKEQLLHETWDTAKTFLADESIPDEDALEYAALTVAGGIIYTHPFIDGNGRTSRFLSYIMAQGGKDEETLSAIAESEGQLGTNEWLVSPSYKIAQWKRQQYKGDQPKKIEWKSNLMK